MWILVYSLFGDVTLMSELGVGGVGRQYPGGREEGKRRRAEREKIRIKIRFGKTSMARRIRKKYRRSGGT